MKMSKRHQEASENSSSNQVQKVENTSTTFSAPTDYVEKSKMVIGISTISSPMYRIQAFKN